MIQKHWSHWYRELWEPSLHTGQGSPWQKSRLTWHLKEENVGMEEQCGQSVVIGHINLAFVYLANSSFGYLPPTPSLWWGIWAHREGEWFVSGLRLECCVWSMAQANQSGSTMSPEHSTKLQRQQRDSRWEPYHSIREEKSKLLHSVNAAATESSLQHPDLPISNFLHHMQHWETVSQVGSRHGKKLSGDHTGPHCPEDQERLWEKVSYWLII